MELSRMSFVAIGERLRRTATFADLIEMIGDDTELAPRVRSDIRSGVRRFCEALGRAPHDLAWDPASLRDGLRASHYLQIPCSRGAAPNISSKTWANAKSCVRRALRRYTHLLPPSAKLSPAWGALLA